MIEAPAPPRETTTSNHLVVRFRPLYAMTPDEFFEFCRLNPDLVVELTAEGEVVFMSPSGGATGARNANIVIALGQWASKDKTGIVFDSSAGFTMSDNAVRSPDASWVNRERWIALPTIQRERFAPICPDFVVEVASPSDRLSDLQAKMEEYIASGAQLGWLIVPESRAVYVYRPGQEAELLNKARSIDGDPVLPGFKLDLRPIWNPGF